MKTPFEAAVSRVYPHIVTRGARRPHFWSVTVSNVPLGKGGLTGPYAFVGVGMLDARGRITAKGRQTIDAYVAGLAEKHGIDYCVVWSEDDCTWYDRDGNGRSGDLPPQACDTGNAYLYDSLPYRLEDCWTVALPEGSIPSHIGMYDHPKLAQQLDARAPARGYGVSVANSQFWYEVWFEKVVEELGEGWTRAAAG